MNARKEESKGKKYSSLPHDFNQLIEEVLRHTEQASLWDSFSLRVSGRIYPEELVVRCSLQEGKALRCKNFSASLDFSGETKHLLEQSQIAMEALHAMMSDYFESNEDLDMPEDWHAYDFSEQKVYLMFSTENDQLEAEANALLGEEEIESGDLGEFSHEDLGAEFFAEAEERFKTSLH